MKDTYIMQLVKSSMMVNVTEPKQLHAALSGCQVILIRGCSPETRKSQIIYVFRTFFEASSAIKSILVQTALEGLVV